eukprot:Em0006g258a
MASRLAYGSLSFLLVLSSYEGVKAGLNIVPKGVVTICAESKQVFNCTYGNNDSFHQFLLNSTDVSVYDSDGVHSTDMSGARVMILSVPGVQKFNNTSVGCKSQSDQSGPTLLIVQDPPLAPIIINATCFNDSILLLYLSLPSDVSDESLITYNITVMLPNGTLLLQAIVRLHQTSIVMKGCISCHPCAIYVQSLCGTAAGGGANTTMNYPDPFFAANQSIVPTQGSTFISDFSGGSSMIHVIIMIVAFVIVAVGGVLVAMLCLYLRKRKKMNVAMLDNEETSAVSVMMTGRANGLEKRQASTQKTRELHVSVRVQDIADVPTTSTVPFSEQSPPSHRVDGESHDTADQDEERFLSVAVQVSVQSTAVPTRGDNSNA